ncbi:MAG: nucleotidyltransferase domain-containing protein [Candidatus Bathyarchaeia archaeon]
MSRDPIIEAALKRRDTFKNLKENLKTLKNVVKKLDQEAQIYLFGSVAEESYTYSSDIDILIITKLYPAKIHAELWKAGISEPFEIHVHTPEKAEFYKGKMKLVEI